MPIVKTKKMMDGMASGEVLEVRATDKGSIADLQSWSKRTGHQYIGMKEENGVFRHFLRKASDNEAKTKVKYAHTISNDVLQEKLASGENLTVLDVRKPAEYAFQRILGAISIPVGELEEKLSQLDQKQVYYVIFRTGNRSDMACQLLSEHGFTNVRNVVPGMSEWKGNLKETK